MNTLLDRKVESLLCKTFEVVRTELRQSKLEKLMYMYHIIEEDESDYVFLSLQGNELCVRTELNCVVGHIRATDIDTSFDAPARKYASLNDAVCSCFEEFH